MFEYATDQTVTISYQQLSLQTCQLRTATHILHHLWNRRLKVKKKKKKKTTTNKYNVDNVIPPPTVLYYLQFQGSASLVVCDYYCHCSSAFYLSLTLFTPRIRRICLFPSVSNTCSCGTFRYFQFVHVVFRRVRLYC